MSCGSVTGTFIEDSSSAANFSSLDSHSALSDTERPESPVGRTHFLEPYGRTARRRRLSSRRSTDVVAPAPLPEFTAVELERYIASDIHRTLNISDDGSNDELVHLIMFYVHSMQYVVVQFVKMNGAEDSGVCSGKLLMFSDDRPYPSMLHSVANKFNVDYRHLILCELWRCILTKLKHESVSMLAPSDVIVAYFVPSFVPLRESLFPEFRNSELSYTTLIHQCSVEEGHRDADGRSPDAKRVSISKSLTNTFQPEPTISELSACSGGAGLSGGGALGHLLLSPDPNVNASFMDLLSMRHGHLLLSPEITDRVSDEHDVAGGARKRGHFRPSTPSNLFSGVANVGVPVPFMMPKNAVVPTAVIAQQCEMILRPYFDDAMAAKQSEALYTLYLLTKSTMRCAICLHNAYCRGCELMKAEEISTGELDFIVSVRWTDEAAFSAFDKAGFARN